MYNSDSDNLMRILLNIIFCFSLIVFNIFSIIFSFCQFDYYVSEHVAPWINPVWDSQYFLNLSDCFLSHVGEISAILSSIIFSGPFSLSSPTGTLIMWMLVHLTLSQRSLKLSSFLLITFSFILFHGSNFYNSVFQLIYLFFCLIYSATNSF